MEERVFSNKRYQKNIYNIFYDETENIPLLTYAPSEKIKVYYPSNPRNYFGNENEIEYSFNSWGFRGEEFLSQKPKNALRIAFVGDSYTAAEGVKFSDTFPELVKEHFAKKLSNKNIRVESYNFGVGSMNTLQELMIFKKYVLKTNPDMVVIGYHPNDLDMIAIGVTRDHYDRIKFFPITRSYHQKIPDNVFFRLKIVRVPFLMIKVNQVSEKTVAFYKELYSEKNKEWISKNTNALLEIKKICDAKKIPLRVFVFPILYKLNDEHPFRELHEYVGRFFEQNKIQHKDLLISFYGKDERELWVHNIDRHPNEAAQKLIAKEVIDDLAPVITEMVQSKTATRHRVATVKCEQ